MTQSEWLELYKEKTGCKDLEPYDGEQVFFHPDYGFLTYCIHDNVLEIHHCCGDGKQWAKLTKKIMELNGLQKVRFFTKRSPKAWERKYGAHIRAYYMEADINDIKE